MVLKVESLNVMVWCGWFGMGGLSGFVGWDGWFGMGGLSGFVGWDGWVGWVG